jgi:uncharacterized membrane protein
VAFFAEFFSYFFVHFHEACMVIIVGQMFGGLFRRVPEKHEKARTDGNKYQVVDEDVFSFRFLF